MTELRKLNMKGVVDDGNSTTTPLAGDATFTGTAVEILDYGIVFVSVSSDVSSATDGLKIEQSSDGTNWDWDDSFTISGGNAKNFSVNPHARYLRVRYVNGSTVQGSFRLQTILKGNSKPSTHRIQDSIRDDDDAELVKAILTAKSNGSADFINIQATAKGNFKVAVQEYGDTPSIDPFDRLRVSTAYTLFDSKQLHDKQPLFWDESIGGAATSVHSSVNAATTMSVGASASDFVIRQTKQRLNYQPGKGQLILMTFTFGAQATGVTKRVGIFDGTGANYLTPNNGIFFQDNGTTLSWNIAKNGTVTQSIPQSSWNVDTLDGNGTSGITLDVTAPQIAIIDYEWLGVGRVRVGFVVNGIIRYCHYFNHANDPTFSSVYMSTPNLPLRYGIQSDGSASSSIDHICCSVMSEGGVEETGVLRTIDTGATHLNADAADTTYALIGIRLKAAYLDITVLPLAMSMMSETSTAFRWSLQLNPTVAGTFTYSDVTNSAIQSAIGVTANTITAEGFKIASGYVSDSDKSGSSASGELQSFLRMGSTIAGVADQLVLCVTPLSANADIMGSLTLREML